MSADLDLAAAAASLGRSYSWMQKHWRTLRHDATGQPFPRPHIGAALGQRPRWLAAAVEAWKAGALVDTAGHPAQRGTAIAADNDAAPIPVTDRVAALLAVAGS